jgi:hypothetical protein
MAGWQGLWTNEAGVPAGYSLLVDKSTQRNRIKRVMNREQFRAIKELFDTLIGAAAGGAALATHARVGHPATPIAVAALGGSRTIDTITDINRVSAAGDITALKEMTVNVAVNTNAHARDLSGNGSAGTL